MNTTKASPEAVESERAILGGMIIDPDRIDVIVTQLDAADFYRPDHGRLFMLLRMMRSRREPIDLVTVADAVQRGGDAEQYGGFSYVLGLPDRVPSTANLTHYARNVRDAARARSAIRLARETIAALEAKSEPVEAVLGRLETQTAGLRSASTSSSVVGIVEAFQTATNEMMGEASAEHGDPTPPFVALREFVPFWKRGAVYVVGARPKMGKTALALDIVLKSASDGFGVFVASLEMPVSQLIERHVASVGHVDYGQIMRRGLDEEGWDRWDKAGRSLADLPLTYADCPGATADEIVGHMYAARARLEKAGTPLRIVVVDYLGLINAQMGPRDHESQAIGRILKTLINAARRLDVTVILLSQLNRDLEKRADKRPTPADFRGSGEIEQDAYCILALYREAVYDPSADPHEAEVLVLANRGGTTGKALVRFDGRHQTFDDPKRFTGLHIVD